MTPREILASEYVEKYSGPVLFIDPQVAYDKVKQFRVAMPRVEVNYAIKSNPYVDVLRAVAEAGGSFDVASLQEAELALDLADASTIVYSNPVRPAHYLSKCSAQGIKWFVVDNIHELMKVVNHVEDPQIYIRLDIPNDKAAYSLAGKFGVELAEATRIVDYCAEHRINLRGCSFHAGSQMTDKHGWLNGIRAAKKLFHYMEYKGLRADFLNLGGGFPAAYHSEHNTTINQIGQVINEEINDLPDYFRIIAEPGRYICAEAGHLLAQVISTTVRNNQMWAYLDTGVFHGTFEPHCSDAFLYHTETVSNKPRVKFTVAGPTCDSMDIVSKNMYLPHNLEDGDFVVFRNAGAYSITYATNFNGFPMPKVVAFNQRGDYHG